MMLVIRAVTTEHNFILASNCALLQLLLILLLSSSLLLFITGHLLLEPSVFSCVVFLLCLRHAARLLVAQARTCS